MFVKNLNVVTKECPKCQEVKPGHAFGTQKGGKYLRGICRDCAAAYARERYKAKQLERGKAERKAARKQEQPAKETVSLSRQLLAEWLADEDLRKEILAALKSKAPPA